MIRWIFILTGMGCFLFGPPAAGASGSQCIGWIAVESLPEEGASITLDGEKTSHQTPATLKNVPCGRHAVGVTLPDYRDSTLKIQVSNNQVHKVRIELAPAFGSIHVTAKPEKGAMVYLDGDSVGNPPFSLNRIASGSHRIRVEKENYAPFETRITVQDGKQSVVNASLKRYTGRLMVDTIPFAARISIGGRPAIPAPVAVINVPAGSLVIVAEAEGYPQLTQRIEIEKDHMTVTELNLIKPPKSFFEIHAIMDSPPTDALDAGSGDLELVPLVPADYQQTKKRKPKKKTVVARKQPPAPAPKPAPERNDGLGMGPDGRLAKVPDANSPVVRTQLERELSPRRTLAWVAAGTAATAAVASVVLFAMGASTQSDANSLAGKMKTETDDPYVRREIQARVLALDNDAARQMNGGWVCAGVFAVAAGAWLYLFLTETEPEQPSTGIRAAALPGGGGWVGIQGRF